MCGEELGDPAAEKYDVEAWMPGECDNETMMVVS